MSPARASLQMPEADVVTGLIRDVARREILPRFRRLRRDERWEKRPGSVVTAADREAELKLAAGLVALLPRSCAVGEEAAEERPGVLSLLAGDDPVWVIDPVDGTANFAAGKPEFVVMVGLVVAGETRAGWIHSPVTNSTAVAVMGKGAWIDNERLSVARPVPLKEMTGSLGPRLRRNKAFSGRFARVVYSGCCGIDYLAMVRGERHFAFYRRLKPWDHVAGQLLHREAGGYNACLDGARYDPASPDAEGLLLAPDRDSWERIAAGIPAALAGSD